MEKQQYTLMGLLEAYKVEIPIIQRDYAQGRRDKDTERVRSIFLNDLHGALADHKPMNLDFVYGDVRNGTLAPLDGQQRLTTLVLLHWYAAKREEVGPEELSPLGKFSYATRVSARKFFEELTDFTPKWGEGIIISEQIRDQHWYAARWDNDPTIKSALVMLDAIDDKFAHLASPTDKRLWQSLTKENLITFFFLPIDDMGMTDDLYVKMNSRGKPLTEFEHLKAMMESRIKTFDEGAAERIGRKIDAEWTRTLWSHARDKANNTADSAFVRYILFIANIVRRRKGETPIGDIFDALDVLFGDAADRDGNVHLLELMFGIWCDVGDIQAFFDGLYTRNEHEAGKIRVFTDGKENNPFLMCCYDTNFGLPNQVWLYAVCTYLLNKERIADCDSLRRLRTVNNLISASAVSEENMKTILGQVDKIVRDGIVEYAPNGFAKTQIDEELKKWEYMNEHPESGAPIHKLEDHHLLRGTIHIVGLDHLKLCDKFYALFDRGIDPLLRCRAMLAQGDYSQLVNKNLHWWGWPLYRFATASDENGWYSLFHPSQDLRNEELNERTSRVLHELLERLDTINNETLQGVVDIYLEEQRTEAQFDWRYYMVRYGDRLMDNGNGYYAWKCDNGNEDPYIFFRLSGKTASFLYTHWVALLHILQTAREGRIWLPVWHHGYYGSSKHNIPLELKKNDEPRFYIRLRSNQYDVYDSRDEFIRHVEIEQKDGVDTQDRIEIGLELIDELWQSC